jgi:hypothetical protein
MWFIGLDSLMIQFKTYGTKEKNKLKISKYKIMAKFRCMVYSNGVTYLSS